MRQNTTQSAQVDGLTDFAVDPVFATGAIFEDGTLESLNAFAPEEPVAIPVQQELAQINGSLDPYPLPSGTASLEINQPTLIPNVATLLEPNLNQPLPLELEGRRIPSRPTATNLDRDANDDDTVEDTDNPVEADELGSQTATLVGFASLPAQTFAPGPPSGADNGMGGPISANGITGPFDGQPVQGFSGVQFADNNSFWFLSDNGFGSKANSADFLLRAYRVDPNFAGSESGDGSVAIEEFIQFSDPRRLVPFQIVNEDTVERHLTGADFDLESIVIAPNGDIWLGEEFGPFILHFNAQGELIEAPIPTPNPSGGFVRSPDNPTNFNTLTGAAAIVIGHRGASGERPEHTLEAYSLAIEQGADFIEPDLVPTKDGVLIARHEPFLAEVQIDASGNIIRDANGNPIVLSETTNVAALPQFADRVTVKNLDGDLIGGWFAEDFTLAEIKQMRARERIPSIRPNNTQFNDLFEIPTLAEVIALVQEVEATSGRRIGIYPETKHPTYFEFAENFLDGTPINIDTSEILVRTLVETGFTDPDRVFIQSFEIQNLLELQTVFFPAAGIDLPLVQLTGDVTGTEGSFSAPFDVVFNTSQADFSAAAAQAIYGDLVNIIDLEAAGAIAGEGAGYAQLFTAAALDYLGENYAEGIGPWKNSFLLRKPISPPVDGNGDGVAQISSQLTGEIFPLIELAHDAGLLVHPYTLRNEENFLVLNADGTAQSPEDEFRQLIGLGADGFFTDFPATGRTVVDTAVDTVVNLARSRGFEGMASSPDGRTLYPLLEGTVEGDPEGSLRIYEFDRASSSFAETVRFYPLADPNHAIGDFTVINENEFVVIERDNLQGEAANFKKIFKINLSEVDENGFVAKEELVDLLAIADPNDLNGNGSTRFEFPFVTIENLLVIDQNTLLVANDNNFPFSTGRAPAPIIDNNEIILLQLPEPLNLAPQVGLATDGEEELAIGSPPDLEGLLDGFDESLVADSEDDLGDLGLAATEEGGLSAGAGDRRWGGSGYDFLMGQTGSRGNLLDGRGGNDVLVAGTGDRLFGGDEEDQLFITEGGNNILTGGAGADQFWIVNGELPVTLNTITDYRIGEDVLGIAGGGANTLADLTFTQEGADTLISIQSVAVARLLGIEASALSARGIFAFA